MNFYIVYRVVYYSVLALFVVVALAGAIISLFRFYRKYQNLSGSSKYLIKGVFKKPFTDMIKKALKSNFSIIIIIMVLLIIWIVLNYFILKIA